MGDEPPELTLAAQNSDAELQKQDALARFDWEVRAFVANLLRIMRGAGRPFRLLNDLNDLVECIRGMDGVSVYEATEQFRETLQSAMRQDMDDWGIPGARQIIARGALQMLASELVGQSTQKRAGESEISDGIRAIEEVREENRKRWQEEAATRSIRKPSKSTLKRRHEAVRAMIAAPEKPEESPKPSTADMMRKRAQELRKKPRT